MTEVLKSLKLAYKPRQIKNPSLKITHKLKNMVTFVYESKVVIIIMNRSDILNYVECP